MGKNKQTSKSFDSEIAKLNSHLSKDINRIRRTCEMQIRMNTLRKYQIKKINEFLKKLILEKRIKKEELKPYFIKKKEAEKILFK